MHVRASHFQLQFTLVCLTVWCIKNRFSFNPGAINLFPVEIHLDVSCNLLSIVDADNDTTSFLKCMMSTTKKLVHMTSLIVRYLRIEVEYDLVQTISVELFLTSMCSANATSFSS